jgi:FixJ family two-component response regulator
LPPSPELPSPVRITIIDDDEFVREAVERLIRSLGYDAETFASAEDYLNQSNVADTQCLITDVHMSGLTGVELQTHLIAAGHRIPIIFMSGYSEDTVRATAIRNGAVGFLAKPIRVADLIECLNKALKP